MREFPRKCPFCPTQNERMFDEIGLFQHAIATSKFNPNADTVRAHMALLNDLRKWLNIGPSQKSSLLHPAANSDSERKTQYISPAQEAYTTNMDRSDRDVNQNSEVKVVWPWMGIVMNVDFKQLASKENNNSKGSNGNANLINNLWNMDLKGHFSCFNPRGVQALWNQQLAVLDFGHDLLGCFDAQDFSKGFAQLGRGKRDFQNMEKLKKDRVQEMFGWIADEKDYHLSNSVGEFLRRKGTLRVMPHFSNAWSEQQDQLFQDMRLKIQDKNLKLIELKREVCNLQTSVFQRENVKLSAESQFFAKELKQKQEFETIRKNTEKVIRESKAELLKEKDKISSLQAELRDSKRKCQLLEENSTQSISDETILQQLIDLVEEKELLESEIQNLTYKEREANDKVQNAMNAAREALENKGNAKSIGLKRMGVLNDVPWNKACAVRFKHEEGGWQLPCKKLMSVWDQYLRDASWYPYKHVTIEGGRIEEVIDSEDEKLAELKQEFGAEVYMTVVDALNELQESNPSGRFPVSVPWNFERRRAAQLDEIIRYLANDTPKKKLGFLCSPSVNSTHSMHKD